MIVEINIFVQKPLVTRSLPYRPSELKLPYRAKNWEKGPVNLPGPRGVTPWGEERAWRSLQIGVLETLT